MYRTTIEMTSTTQTINMPQSWFPHLVSDVCIHMNPFKHFGSGWGEMLDGDSIQLHVSTIGTWHVLITGLRKDTCGLECLNMPIEYQEPIVKYTTVAPIIEVDEMPKSSARKT